MVAADQRERRQVDAHARADGTLADHQVEREVLHRRIEHLLDAGRSRWISSMKSTSRGSRLVRMAARSPALASTGPEVARNPTPSSRAMICASVVLPRPGRTEQQHVVERLAAGPRGVDEHRRFSREARWPTNSARVWGRSEASAASSSRRAGETVRSVSLKYHAPCAGRAVVRAKQENWPQINADERR